MAELWSVSDPNGRDVTLDDRGWTHILERRREHIDNDYESDFCEQLRLTALSPMFIATAHSRSYGQSEVYVRCLEHPEFNSYIVTLFTKPAVLDQWEIPSRVVRSAVISSTFDTKYLDDILHGGCQDAATPCGGTPRAVMRQRLIAEPSVLERLRAHLENPSTVGPRND